MVSFEEEEQLYNVTNARIKHIKLERKERRDEKTAHFEARIKNLLHVI